MAFYDEEDFDYSLTLPSTITEYSEAAFDGLGVSALIWNSNKPLSNRQFEECDISTENFLLYVKASDLAPSKIKNIIVNDIAEKIVLSNNAPFHCPREFTARQISYRKAFRLQTGLNGECAGWETIVLPFDVQNISHATKGVLTPFADFASGGSSKPFWLYSYSENGFVKASSIKANIPYLIAMPHNSSYSSSYDLSGSVTFSATNTKVLTSYSINVADNEYEFYPSSQGKTFIPSYYYYPAYPQYFVLNRTEYKDITGTIYPAGSKFFESLFQCSPFEAFFFMEDANVKGFIDIEFADDQETSVNGWINAENTHQSQDVFTISGQKVKSMLTDEHGIHNSQLPKGIYIIRGKKIMVK